MRSISAMLTSAALVLACSACGGDDDTSTDDPGDTQAGDEAEADEPAAEPAADEPASSGQNGAVLTLANGETFEFSILCSLEPQTAAGSEILFTAVSYDTPSLDITQFGDEGTITGIATISVYDENYETLWEAGSFYEAVGGTIELSLDGSTISGSGSFFPGGDIAATPVDGDVVADC